MIFNAAIWWILSQLPHRALQTAKTSVLNASIMLSVIQLLCYVNIVMVYLVSAIHRISDDLLMNGILPALDSHDREPLAKTNRKIRRMARIHARNEIRYHYHEILDVLALSVAEFIFLFPRLPASQSLDSASMNRIETLGRHDLVIGMTDLRANIHIGKLLVFPMINGNIGDCFLAECTRRSDVNLTKVHPIQEEHKIKVLHCALQSAIGQSGWTIRIGDSSLVAKGRAHRGERLVVRFLILLRWIRTFLKYTSQEMVFAVATAAALSVISVFLLENIINA